MKRELAPKLDREKRKLRQATTKLARADDAVEKAKVRGKKKIVERTRLEAAAAQEREEKRVVGGPVGLRSSGVGIVRPGSTPRSVGDSTAVNRKRRRRQVPTSDGPRRRRRILTSDMQVSPIVTGVL
jgi:hypothetical protein